MLKIFTMALGAYQTNCYLVWQEGRKDCLVIDPGYEAQTVAAQAEKRGLEIAGVLLTHGHFDHVEAVRELVMDRDIPVYLNAKDTRGTPPARCACWRKITCSPGIPCSGAPAAEPTCREAAGRRCRLPLKS